MTSIPSDNSSKLSGSEGSFEQIQEGARAEHEFVVDAALYRAFLEMFGDRSLVHTDAGFAQANGFEGLVMHGAILNGFLSHFVGMCLPGEKSLELSVDIRYLKPVYAGDRVRMTGEIIQKLESRRVVVLDVVWNNLTRGATAARARVQVALLEPQTGA